MRACGARAGHTKRAGHTEREGAGRARDQGGAEHRAVDGAVKWNLAVAEATQRSAKAATLVEVKTVDGFQVRAMAAHSYHRPSPDPSVPPPHQIP